MYMLSGKLLPKTQKELKVAIPVRTSSLSLTSLKLKKN